MADNTTTGTVDTASAAVPAPAPAPAVAPAAPVFPGGYNGKILRVNLSTGASSTESITEQFCRKWLGGAGFVAYFLWKELKPGVDPLSPDNKLIFALGPCSGLLLPGAARNCIGAKSPMSGGIAKSECGGFWAAELKRAGFDAIIIEGKAKNRFIFGYMTAKLPCVMRPISGVRILWKPKLWCVKNWAIIKSTWR